MKKTPKTCKYCMFQLLQNLQKLFTVELYCDINLFCLFFKAQLGRSIAKQF